VDVVIDRLIHEPSRLRLMSLLYVVDEADFVYLSSQTGFTAGNISSHMARLDEAGYVEISKAFVDRKPRTVYRLTTDVRHALNGYRAAMTELLAPIRAER